MEIPEYLEEYRKHSSKEFFEWLAKDKVIEVRFLNDCYGVKFHDWALIKEIAKTIDCESRFSSIFISSWEELNTILRYKIDGKYTATRMYNIFIGVNPRRKVFVKSARGLVFKSYYGGIAGTSHIQTILCDIEHCAERKENATKAMLEECIQGGKFLISELKLQSFFLNISGNGVHLWFDLQEPIELTIPSFFEYEDKIKYNLKEEPIYTHIKTYNNYITKLDRILKKFNPKLKVDEGAKDIARIARPPTSLNVKQGLVPRYVGTVYKNISNIKYNNQNFTAAKPILNKKSRELLKRVEKTNKHRYNTTNIRECPLYKLLVSGYLPSNVSRNHYLEQSFAKILRDNNIRVIEVQDVVREMDIMQRKSVQVDPDYLDDPSPFNPEMVNSYCIACKIPLVYELIEDIPFITEDYITDEKIDQLDNYSDITVEEFRIKDIKTPHSYLELKSLIRELVDESRSKSSIFFTLKYLLRKDWAYYQSQKIIQTLLNKTRKMKK